MAGEDREGGVAAAASGPDVDPDPLGLLDDEALKVAIDALDRVEEVLGRTRERADDDSGPHDRVTIVRELRAAWDDATAQARVRALSGDDPDRLIALLDLLNVVHTAEGFVGAGPSGNGSPVRRIRDRLHALDAAGSLEELLDQTPVVAAGLGFNRVLLSRIEGSTWRPERLYIRGDARWAEQILEALSREPVVLDTSVLETQMVRRAVPLLVKDPANRPLMHRLMITLSLTRGYVAAPIVVHGDVVGFMHADCYYQGRVPSQGDVDALWLFSQALGPMRARQSLADRLAELRREVEKPDALFGARRPHVSVDPSAKPRRVGGQASAAPRPAHALHEIVTQREADVLRLVSEGASNEQIARRLAISIGTVKSHVKRILRKLDVSNRAEAASLWLRSEYGQMPAGPASRG